MPLDTINSTSETHESVRLKINTNFAAVDAKADHAITAQQIAADALATAQDALATAQEALDSVGSGGPGPSGSGSVLNVMDYGAYADGTHAAETTAAFVEAIADAQAVEAGTLFVPAGEFLITQGTLTITAPMTLTGAGRGVTRIRTTGTTSFLLKVLTATPAAPWSAGNATSIPLLRDTPSVHIRDLDLLRLENTSPASGSVGLWLADSLSENTLTTLRGCCISGFSTGVLCDNAVMFWFTENIFHVNRKYSIRCTNNQASDHGDFLIENNKFWSFYATGIDTTGAHIRMEGGVAGGHVRGNKFWGTFLRAIDVNMSMTAEALYTGIATAILTFEANDFDQLGATAPAIVIDSQFGRGGAGTALNGNRLVQVRIASNTTQNTRLLEIKTLVNALEDVSVHANSCTMGAGVVISGVINGFSFLGNHMVNAGAFATSTTGKYLTITGTVLNARNHGTYHRGYDPTTPSDLEEDGEAAEPTTLTDTFTGTGTLLAHTSDSGHSWVDGFATGYDINLSGGFACPEATSPVNQLDYISSFTPASADASATVTAKKGSINGLAAIGAWLRVSDEGNAATINGYLGRYLQGSGFQFYRFIDGTYTQLGSNVVGTLADGDTLKLIASGVGATITLTLQKNGVTVADEDDTNAARIVTNGKVGLAIINESGSTSENFQASAITAV